MSAVSYVAVKVPLVRNHANWRAIWIYASGESRAVNHEGGDFVRTEFQVV